MKNMTTTEFQKALETAGRLKGSDGVFHQKKLILENYMITDENGLAVDPESLDVTITAGSAPAAEVEQDGATADRIAEKVADSVRKSLSTRVIEQKLGVVAEPKAWETAKIYGRGLKHLKSRETAYRFGTWCLAAMGHKKSADWCSRNGMILQKGHVEGLNVQGGFLVPEEMENELVTLREQYGVFRREAKIYPMGSDTLRIPRRNATLTAYFVGEAAAGTESQQTFDSVQLVAKKLMALTTVSNELLEDAVINIGDDIAGEVAYAFANKEDDCGFNGDGTSTYGGIVGLTTALSNGTYQVSTGAVDTKVGQTTADVAAAFAKLAGWAAQRNNIKIFTNKQTYHAVFERLMIAGGGNTFRDIAAGGQNGQAAIPTYLGYEVVFSQAIAVPADTNGLVIGYIGDLSQACYFGDRRTTSVAFSDAALNAFEQDERVVRGTQRFDIVCANVGSASAYGPIVKYTI